jgi:hypothetical protein
LERITTDGKAVSHQPRSVRLSRVFSGEQHKKSTRMIGGHFTGWNKPA